MPGESLCGPADSSNRTDWLVGTAFLKNVYTVFDFATPAVGFAALAPGAQPSAAARDVTSHARPAIAVSAALGVGAVAASFLCML
jgi:hypothetical protein